MYARLFQNTPNTPALTDDQKYPCPSLPIPGPAFSMYEEPVIHNREYYQPMVEPMLQQSMLQPMGQPMLQPMLQPMRTPLSFITPVPSVVIPTSIPKQLHTLSDNEDGNLLPVLDCRFNLREICKQSILLEDHLSHDKKRCTDCCIKHFLALEGLCEEAVTLDKEHHHKNLQGLAEKIRRIQKMWYEDPSGNSHQCSQELRKIRKEFMMDVFPMIFESSGNACGDGMCTFVPRPKSA